MADALSNSLDLARAAEAAGYYRYWVAEHHNMVGIASSATAVLIGRLASVTTHMRIGAGGIMLPNHAPLMVAEQFGTLASFFGDRIDLGLGRAPGTDMATARALRRHMRQEDSFAQDVQELQGYLGDAPQDARVRAIPGMGTKLPIWILGSSLYGAQLAAMLGLPYAFASHFAPDMLGEALHVYRSTFQPSQQLSAPYAIVAASVCAAETDDEAIYLRSSMVQSFANLVTNNRGKVQPPMEDVESKYGPAVMAQVNRMLACSATGAPESLRTQLGAIIDAYKPDELMVTGMTYDHGARVRSFEIAAQVLAEFVAT